MSRPGENLLPRILEGVICHIQRRKGNAFASVHTSIWNKPRIAHCSFYTVGDFPEENLMQRNVLLLIVVSLLVSLSFSQTSSPKLRLPHPRLGLHLISAATWTTTRWPTYTSSAWTP